MPQGQAELGLPCARLMNFSKYHCLLIEVALLFRDLHQGCRVINLRYEGNASCKKQGCSYFREHILHVQTLQAKSSRFCVFTCFWFMCYGVQHYVSYYHCLDCLDYRKVASINWLFINICKDLWRLTILTAVWLHLTVAEDCNVYLIILSYCEKWSPLLDSKIRPKRGQLGMW